MALNIKPYYPLEHPDSSYSVAELIKKISRPQVTGAYLKTDVKKESTFNRDEDLYGFSLFAKNPRTRTRSKSRNIKTFRCYLELCR